MCIWRNVTNSFSFFEIFHNQAFLIVKNTMLNKSQCWDIRIQTFTMVFYIFRKQLNVSVFRKFTNHTIVLFSLNLNRFG